MADSDENTTNNAGSTAADPATKRRATKKSTTKTAKKTAKKTVKKAAKKAAKKTARKSAKRTAKETKAEAPERTPQLIDRSELGDKTRVFALAKALGMPSKDLIVTLNELGLVKVAQSSLTRAETEQVLDALEARAGAAQEQAEDVSDEKIRHRVRKDVENEISQIEDKVDADLGLAVSDEGADLLTDVEPDITPAPEEDEEEEASTGFYAPVFKAPSRTSRRRAQRASASSQQRADDQDDRDARDDRDDQGARADGHHQDDQNETSGKPRGRRSRRSTRAQSGSRSEDKQPNTGLDSSSDNSSDTRGDEDLIQEPKAIKGSSRLEAQRRRRSERREEERKRSRVVSQAEFLARRESVERTMVVRERDRHDGAGRLTQVGVLEDGLLVEHFVDADDSASMIGNIYLGRVQNVLPSMEAAFIDIGTGRNGVLYAGEVDWKAAGLGGRSRRIEQALKSGDQVIVQVTKDPMGHKGARLTTQISLAGRFLVYVPGGRSAGISRKLPAPERKRLKDILVRVVPGKGGAIIRTAAEGASEEAIAADVNRLHTQWEAIQEQAEKEKNSKGAKPVALYEEPKLLVKVVRDLFNEDFDALVVDGKKSWHTVNKYVESVAPDLLDRLEKFNRSEHEGKDAFEVYRIDEQIQKALARTVWLPSGGTLVIDRTEAMTVIDVNTGKFTGSGGSLEETVTSNNMEAAEEIVRQLRLRDIGGMIIIDFIDMILPENQELVLRRLKEALGRDRTRHQVSEVTSLGLVQLTRKRLGTGLVETFSTTCECCEGRGIVLSDDPVDLSTEHTDHPGGGRGKSKRRKPAQDPANHPTALAMQGRGQHDELVESEPVETVVDVESLVDAVVVDAPEADSADTDDAHNDERQEQPKRRSSRRRGRRGGGRGRGRAQQEDQPNEAPEEHLSAQSAAQQEQTYEEAVEEFENSPRRKRRTRGNSKSDHRPRREDFQRPEQPARQETTEAEAPEASEKSGAPEVKKFAGASGRGRRRATRRTSTATLQAGEKQSPQREQKAQATEQTRKQPEQKSAPARGRRRASRKGTS